MPIQFPPEVERWRGTVKRYVPPQYVDKFLWAMYWESGGNEHNVDPTGTSIGLMQVQDDRVFAGRPTADQLFNGEFNIKYAAQQLGAANGNFSAWGEGTTGTGAYDPTTGKGQFGALGDHPFPPIPPGYENVQLYFDPNNPTENYIATIHIPSGNDVLRGTNIPVPHWANPTNFPPISAAIDTGTTIKEGAQGTMQAVVAVANWLLKPQHWFRLFFVLGGLVIAAVGIFIYVKEKPPTFGVAGKVSSAAEAVA